MTIDDCRNLVAFGNRAQMSGREADGWVALKFKLLRQVEDYAQGEKQPQICAVPDNPGGTD